MKTLYLQPLKNPTSHCWYSQEPLGYNKLVGTVSKLCKSTGKPSLLNGHNVTLFTHQALMDNWWWSKLIIKALIVYAYINVLRTTTDCYFRHFKQGQQLVPPWTQDFAQLSSQHPTPFPHSGFTNQCSLSQRHNVILSQENFSSVTVALSLLTSTTISNHCLRILELLYAILTYMFRPLQMRL